jgi:hypothetical protein
MGLHQAGDPSADGNPEPSECSITVALESPGPFRGNFNCKIHPGLIHSGVETESPDTIVFTGQEHLLLLLCGYSHPSFTSIINIA